MGPGWGVELDVVGAVQEAEGHPQGAEQGALQNTHYSEG